MIASNANPGGANWGSRIPVEFSSIWDSGDKLKEGFSVGFQVSNYQGKDRKYENEEIEHKHGNGGLGLHGFLFSMKQRNYASLASAILLVLKKET